MEIIHQYYSDSDIKKESIALYESVTAIFRWFPLAMEARNKGQSNPYQKHSVVYKQKGIVI
jgi:hypothetical protein